VLQRGAQDAAEAAAEAMPDLALAEPTSIRPGARDVGQSRQRSGTGVGNGGVVRIEPADDAMFRERDAWRYEPPYDFYDSDGLPVKNPEFFFAARDDDGTLIGFYFLEPRDGALFYGFGMRPDLTGRGLGEQFVLAGLEFARLLYGARRVVLDVAALNDAPFACIDASVSTRPAGMSRHSTVTAPWSSSTWKSSTDKGLAECDDSPASSLAPRDLVGLVGMRRQSSVRIVAPRGPKRQRICRNACRRSTCSSADNDDYGAAQTYRARRPCTEQHRTALRRATIDK
jgi:ribosomal-protein-alanine N-acetyltransferase